MEAKASIPVGAWIGITFAILVALTAVVKAIWYRRRFIKNQWATKELEGLGCDAHESINLLPVFLDVDFLTKELVNIYKEQTQFQKADIQKNLKTNVCHECQKQEPDIDINIYKDVFERNEQPLKRIIIQGDVGSGKATWCNTLTQDWRKAHDPNNEESNNNITFLKEYKLLFNICLANVHKFANFKDLLKCLPSTVFDQFNIVNYIQKYKTIIIIQDLDECTGELSIVKEILSDKGLDHAVVIITGTSWICSKYSKGASVDRVINVKGLKKDDMIIRAENILKDDFFSREMIDRFNQVK